MNVQRPTKEIEVVKAYCQSTVPNEVHYDLAAVFVNMLIREMKVTPGERANAIIVLANHLSPQAKRRSQMDLVPAEINLSEGARSSVRDFAQRVERMIVETMLQAESYVNRTRADAVFDRPDVVM
jgi:hypothetical protein